MRLLGLYITTQVLAAIVEMYVSHCNPASAMMVIREFLQRPSPISSFPTTSVLAGLCNMLEKARAPQDLQLLVEGMMEHRRVVYRELLYCNTVVYWNIPT